MKRHLRTLGLHALFFLIAVLVGTFGILQHGVSALASGEAVGNVISVVLIYLVLVALEAIFFEKVRAKKESTKVALAITVSLAAGVFAFILFLFAGVLIGGFTENRIVTGIAALALFLVIEWPIRFVMEKLTAHMR
jgi:hypothetical protein